MNRNLILLLAAGALGVILLSLAMNQNSFLGMAPSTPVDTQSQAESADAKQAKAMMARALKYMDEHGTAALIEKINAAAPEFIMANTTCSSWTTPRPSWLIRSILLGSE